MYCTGNFLRPRQSHHDPHHCIMMMLNNDDVGCPGRISASESEDPTSNIVRYTTIIMMRSLMCARNTVTVVHHSGPGGRRTHWQAGTGPRVRAVTVTGTDSDSGCTDIDHLFRLPT
jgi:hypothetical protein